MLNALRMLSSIDIPVSDKGLKRSYSFLIATDRTALGRYFSKAVSSSILLTYWLVITCSIMAFNSLSSRSVHTIFLQLSCVISLIFELCSHAATDLFHVLFNEFYDAVVVLCILITHPSALHQFECFKRNFHGFNTVSINGGR